MNVQIVRGNPDVLIYYGTRYEASQTDDHYILTNGENRLTFRKSSLGKMGCADELCKNNTPPIFHEAYGALNELFKN